MSGMGGMYGMGSLYGGIVQGSGAGSQNSLYSNYGNSQALGTQSQQSQYQIPGAQPWYNQMSQGLGGAYTAVGNNLTNQWGQLDQNVMGGMGSIFGAAMGGANALGADELKQLKDFYDQTWGQDQQSLQNRGLSNTTVQDSMRQGLAESEARQVPLTMEDIYKQKLNVLGQFGSPIPQEQAALGQAGLAAQQNLNQQGLGAQQALDQQLGGLVGQQGIQTSAGTNAQATNQTGGGAQANNWQQQSAQASQPNQPQPAQPGYGGYGGPPSGGGTGGGGGGIGGPPSGGGGGDYGGYANGAGGSFGGGASGGGSSSGGSSGGGSSGGAYGFGPGVNPNNSPSMTGNPPADYSGYPSGGGFSGYNPSNPNGNPNAVPPSGQFGPGSQAGGPNSYGGEPPGMGNGPGSGVNAPPPSPPADIPGNPFQPPQQFQPSPPGMEGGNPNSPWNKPPGGTTPPAPSPWGQIGGKGGASIDGMAGERDAPGTPPAFGGTNFGGRSPVASASNRGGAPMPQPGIYGGGGMGGAMGRQPAVSQPGIYGAAMGGGGNHGSANALAYGQAHPYPGANPSLGMGSMPTDPAALAAYQRGQGNPANNLGYLTPAYWGAYASRPGYK